MAPHLPSSTLFPYTTLFRSLRQTLTIDDTRRRPLVVHQRNNNDFFVQIFGVAHENAQAQRAYVFGNGTFRDGRILQAGNLDRYGLRRAFLKSSRALEHFAGGLPAMTFLAGERERQETERHNLTGVVT